MIETGRYQWMIGVVALVMVIAFSVVLYTHSRHGRPGVPAGHSLRKFVAPLAIGGPDDSANISPVCDPARPAKGGLNVCGRGAIVLDLFAANGAPCVKSVSALQTAAKALAPPGGPSQIMFAAVAAGASRSQTRLLVREHHWSLPVAFDPSGAVGDLYDVTICPMIEIAGRGGKVKRLLVGERYQSAKAIEIAVRSALR